MPKLDRRPTPGVDPSMTYRFAMRRVFCCIVAAVLFPVMLSAQAFEGRPCQLPGNSRLKSMLASGMIDRLETYFGNYGMWASSFLAPSGKAPKAPDTKDDEAQLAFQEAFVKWSCQYDPGKAQDGNPATAWVEGADGQGIGEILVVQVNTQRPVRIWTGYGKSSALHAANARPRKVRVHVLQAMQLPGDTQISTVFHDLKAMSSHELELRDVNGFQPLPLPAHKIQAVRTSAGDLWPLDDSRYEQMTFVAIEIISVYPGTKYQDTAISEVGNDPAK